MKYLDIPRINLISTFLTECSLGDCILDGRVEVYSCKEVKEDRRLRQYIKEQYAEEELGSSYNSNRTLGSISDTPGGLKLLTMLISTLNASYPDYDFSTVKASQFVKESFLSAKKLIDNYLNEVFDTHSNYATDNMWETIDEVIKVNNCMIYSYQTNMERPFCAPNSLWSFNYIFYNKDEKKMIYFTCSAKTTLRSSSGCLYDDEDWCSMNNDSDALYLYDYPESSDDMPWKHETYIQEEEDDDDMYEMMLD